MTVEEIMTIVGTGVAATVAGVGGTLVLLRKRTNGGSTVTQQMDRLERTLERIDDRLQTIDRRCATIAEKVGEQKPELSHLSHRLEQLISEIR